MGDRDRSPPPPVATPLSSFPLPLPPFRDFSISFLLLLSALPLLSPKFGPRALRSILSSLLHLSSLILMYSASLVIILSREFINKTPLRLIFAFSFPLHICMSSGANRCHPTSSPPTKALHPHVSPQHGSIELRPLSPVLLKISVFTSPTSNVEVVKI